MKIGNYNIARDKYNWILQEKKVSDPKHHMAKSDKPQERFIDVGYYGRVEHLINALLNKELLQADVNALEDIKTTLLQIEKRLIFDISEIKERVS